MARTPSANAAYKKGASASLNKTIAELIAFTGKQPKVSTASLRKKLHEMLAALAEQYMKRGFNRGHRESRKMFKATGNVASKLAYEGSRTLFIGQKKTVKLKSAVKKRKP